MRGERRNKNIWLLCFVYGELRERFFAALIPGTGLALGMDEIHHDIG